jgi:hypothetical protein
VRRAVALVLGLLALGCGSWPPFGGAGPGPAPDASQGIELVGEGAVVEFYERASAFYGRLARRRFDSIETYQDEALRDFFRSEEAYADYYADLTGALVEAHFEKNRPIALEVLELRLEGPGRARVQTRITGADGRPLRRGNVHLERTDRWERTDGTWRIEPGKG